MSEADPRVDGSDVSPGDERLFPRVLAVSAILNLSIGVALSLASVPERTASHARAVPRTALVSFEGDARLPDQARDPDADWLASASTGGGGEGSGGDEGESSAAGGSGSAGGEESSSGSGGSDAAAAEDAFLAAFGDPSAGAAGGGGVLEADVWSGGGGSSSAAEASRPRSGIGGAGEGGARAGRQPLGRGGSGGSGRLGPGEGDGGGIQRSGRITIARGGSRDGGDDASTASADVFERIGDRVREREAQIRFCYEEEGLKQNPDLSGTVRIEFEITAGGVTSANLRSGLEGSGADATEACILQVIRGWRFPDVQEAVTVPFTFVLSR